MQNNQFQLELLVHGFPVTEYQHDGETFIEGRQNSKFTLRVRNNSSCRVVAVVSVDGLSVMNGKTASRLDNGYIIDAYSSVDIPGWRLNDDEVAHFLFSALPEAYATQMGKSQNIGVIGAVFYHEKMPIRSLDLGVTRGGGMMKGSGGTFGAKGVGTGFGSRANHNVSRVSFDREHVPAAQISLRYDDREGLKKRGIRISTPHPQPDRVVEANPFPADSGCTPPTGWRG